MIPEKKLAKCKTIQDLKDLAWEEALKEMEGISKKDNS